MRDDKTGNTAFPTEMNDGMTLRDYFAAKALAGLISDIPNSCYGLYWADRAAETAYEIADAMIRARGEK